jgi:two-component sensor histidine kinase
MKRRTPLSAGQLVLLSSVLALLPAAIFGAYAMYSLVVRDQNAQRQQLLATARALAVGIDHEIDTLRQISSVLASSRLLIGDVENLAAFDDLARDAASAGRYDVVLVDRRAQQLVNTRIELGQPLPISSNRELIKQVFDSGMPFVSELAARSSDGTRTIAIMTPVIARGETHYVLVLTPHLDTVAALFDRVAMQKGWAAAIDDPSGTIVARSIDPAKYVGTKARLRSDRETDIVRFDDLEGRPSHMAYYVSPETRFRAVVWAPEAVFYESTNVLRRSFGIIAALALLVAAAASLAAARFVRWPIRTLVETARRLGQGEPVTHKPSIMSEANVVGEALEQASRTIAAREASLRKETAKTVALAREVAHRTKNVMAVVAAIARQSIRTSKSPQEFAVIFEGRLGGLARSLDLLVETDWEGVALEALVRHQLMAFADEHRFSASGPKVLLAPPAVQNIGMALHELATNAVKYGALSAAGGHVAILWRVEDGRFTLTWTERNGPRTETPQRRGFGRSVIEDLAASSLSGTAQLTFEPEGVTWALEAPLSSLQANVRRGPEGTPGLSA